MSLKLATMIETPSSISYQNLISIEKPFNYRKEKKNISFNPPNHPKSPSPPPHSHTYTLSASFVGFLFEAALKILGQDSTTPHDIVSAKKIFIFIEFCGFDPLINFSEL